MENHSDQWDIIEMHGCSQQRQQSVDSLKTDSSCRDMSPERAHLGNMYESTCMSWHASRNGMYSSPESTKTDTDTLSSTVSSSNHASTSSEEHSISANCAANSFDHHQRSRSPQPQPNCLKNLSLFSELFFVNCGSVVQHKAWRRF